MIMDSIKQRPVDLDIGIIYTYEDHFMPPLLSSLSQSGNDIKMRLLLVDNASEQGTEKWESYFRWTKVIRNHQRLGYAPNLNRILEHSSAPFVLLMNSDMYFDPAEQCLSKIVRYMRRNPDCGVVGCRLYHEDETFAYPARRFPTVRAIAGRRLGLRSLSGEVASHLYHERKPTDTFDCDWLSGCFLMVRRQILQDMETLDVSFRKYFEDVDFCLRTALAGWRVVYYGETYGYHLEQRASKRLISRDAWLHLQSYLRWLRKWGLNPQQRIPEQVQALRKAA